MEGPMIESETLLLFVAASWGLILMPGPDTLYVISRGMALGARAGMFSAAGVVCGIFIHTMAAAAGLTLILQTSSLAFSVVKYAGSVYLVWLGVRAWTENNGYTPDMKLHSVSSGVVFVQGMISNVLNPKIGFFFLSFLPQFVSDTGGSQPLQMFIFGMLFALFGLGFLIVVACFAGSITRWLNNRPRCVLLLHRVSGSSLIVLGLHLGLTERE